MRTCQALGATVGMEQLCTLHWTIKMVRLQRLGDVEACPQRAVAERVQAPGAVPRFDAQGEEKSLVKPLIYCSTSDLLQRRGMAGGN
jgi:hypothetical protein